MLSLKKEVLLVIAPHPDDEVIGCAGLIQQVKSHGGRTYVQFLTNGKTRDFSKKGTSTSEERAREIQRVAAFLKYDGFHVAWDDNSRHLQLDVHGQKAVMQLIERESPLAIETIHPTVIAFPGMTSYNQDHRIASRAIHATLRPAESGSKYYVPTVLMYEMPADQWTLESIQPPNFFIPMTRTQMNKKTQALNLYTSQTRPSPNPRSNESIQALARLRGSQCRSFWAEAFVSLRQVST